MRKACNVVEAFAVSLSGIKPVEALLSCKRSFLVSALLHCLLPEFFSHGKKMPPRSKISSPAVTTYQTRTRTQAMHELQSLQNDKDKEVRGAKVNY